MRRGAERELMEREGRRLFCAEKIRTIWFLLAMIPVVMVTAVVGVLSLVLVSPLILYAFVAGKHIKDPRRNNRLGLPTAD